MEPTKDQHKDRVTSCSGLKVGKGQADYKSDVGGLAVKDTSRSA